MDAVVAQHVGQARRAERAVTLADEELGRVPALVHRQVAQDEAVKGLQVRVHAGEVLGHGLAHGARVAGERRVNEDQVRFVEQRVLVRGQREGRAGCGVGAVRLDAHRGKRPHVQPERGGPGAAVIEEADGAGAGLGAVEGVRDVKNGAVGLVVVVANEQRPGRGSVLERLAVEGQFVVRGNALLRRNGGFLLLVLVGVLVGGGIGCGGGALLGKEGGRR